ncbi:MAG: radical SAM protein [Nanoarchaeota archaeon]|nr:radical SAM protein [Nanoarchaeota archaeon]
MKIIKAISLEKCGINTPLRVAHTCTFKCNLRCNYCGWWKREYKEMTTPEIKSIMKEFSEMGTVAWSFGGGEPLIMKDIGKLINYSKDLGFISNLTTNGFLVKKNIRTLKNLDLLTISLDGPKWVHDKIRGKGAFDKVIEAIKLCKRNNINVSALPVLSNLNLANNCKGLKEVLELLEKLDCKFLTQPLYTDNHNTQILNKEKITLNPEEYNKALNLVEEFGKRTKLSLLSPSEIKWFRNFNKKESCWKCYAGKLFCVLLPDGQLIPCNILETKTQNGLELGFKTAFKKLYKSGKTCKCGLACATKYNMLFSLKFDAIFNQIRHI